MSFQDDLEAAAKSALCGWLANGGNAQVASWIVQGSKTPATAVAGAAAGLGLLAVNYGCNFDPDAGKPADDQQASGCKEAASGYLELGYYETGGGFSIPGGRQLRRIESVWKSQKTCGPGQTAWSWRAVQTDGARFDVDDLCIVATAMVGRLSTGGTCKESFRDPGAPVPLPPVTYTNPTTNCIYVVEHEAWTMRDDGTVAPVLKISPGATPFASGGVIGGCNFGPVLYVPGGPGGGPGGGGPVIPWNPGPDGPDGEPWWWPLVRGALGAVAGELVNWLLDQFRPSMADEIAERLTGDKSGLLPAVVYDLTEACPPEGSPAQVHEVPIPQAPALAGLAARSDALEILAQDQKSWKQPVCEPETVNPVGRNISVQFRSTVASPYGEDVLRKELRYRDPSLKPLEEHRDHWRDFEWESGPWMVISTGLLWGKPQVWAKTEAEGKRVLEHAAAICGVDLADKKHRWRVAEVAGVRERPVLRMRVRRDTRGQLWVAERTGPAGLPWLAAQLPSDPRVDG